MSIDSSISSSPPREGSSIPQPPGSAELLRCPSCRLLLWEPVTVSCGHSFCKLCLGGAVPSRCPVCHRRLKLLGVEAARCNVVLCNLLEKCEERESRSARLAACVRSHLARGDLQDALRMAQKGIEMAPEDTSLRLCRAEALAALKRYPEALQDLEAVCRAEPMECKGFYRKGKVLLEMGQRAEALLAWEHCLMLNPHFQPARREMEKVLTWEDVSQPCVAHRGSTGPQEEQDEGGPASSSTQAQEQEEELEAGGGDEVSEHSQGTPVGQWRMPVAVAQSEDRHEANEEEAGAMSKLLPLEDLLSVSDLECSLCIRMFFEPVTTPCGHTFCKECLERCLDHRPNCPLCKQSLREYLKAGSYSPTLLLQDIMLAAFPAQLAERRELHQAEMAELSNLTTNIPIFVCTMSFPGVACPLHIFEPRYRLMIRRCQETGTRRFGMCIYENGKSFADYGCMLEIRQLELLADGRSLVDTIGGRRFRVLRRGHRDGYNTADIEYLEDKKVAGEELQELQSLHESTYQLAQRFWEHGDVASRHLLLQHGPLPEKEEDIQASADGPTWCWWLISILPLDPSFQLRLFSSTSLHARLAQLQRILLALLQPSPEHNPQDLV
ncbi:LON peptidase N-terminal domain and RING finger protein 1-like [Coturnix japonica]|uniref:LON peptidase N-terminal domain and RING finger protein 1-like n=1 Tax=Coturnix japonica TaxID=93934 RepID=A0A8C2T3S5_COTJA|nr:LON peptidase N-terminal domain and RING finger protein 1-like [Coturnix japonica]